MVGDLEGSARGIPELDIERYPLERNAARRGGVIVVRQLDDEPARGEPALPKPSAEPLGEPTEQRMQGAEIVGVGCEGMRGAELRFDFGRQHGTRVDAAGTREKIAPAPSEDGTELPLFD